MKVAYTHHTFLEQKVGGISRYFVKLSEQVRQLGHEALVFPGFHQNSYLKDIPKMIAPGFDIGFLPAVPKGPFHCLNSVICSNQINNWKPDVLHETYYSRFRSTKSGTPVVLTVYDFINERLPGNSYKAEKYIHIKKEAIKRADYIICISEHTKMDLMHFYDVDESKVSVVYLGVDVPDRQSQCHRRDPFILHVGARSRYKNFNNLVKAYASSECLKKSFKIVAFGGNPFSKSERSLFRELHLDANHIERQSGGDKLLTELYSKASLFVYPSLYEGFGIPLIEAMAHLCPVAASNSSSLPEVAGKAAIYFDPSSPESIRLAMEKVLADTSLKQTLVDEGAQRSKAFSWKTCAEQTLSIYMQLSK